MSAPKCRLCGANHWGNESHIFPDDPKPSKKAPEPILPEPEPVTDKAVTVDGLESPETVKKRVKKWRENNRESYNEYMRDLMRRKRREAKGPD